MNSPVLKKDQRVRFEEVTPANTIVAFFDVQLKHVAARLKLPAYEGYDDLDEIQFAFFTLPSGKTVTLGQYEHSPQAGVDLYVDLSIQDIPSVVFESCQQLEIPREKVSWLHPDFQEEIDRLYTEYVDFPGWKESSGVQELSYNSQYEPINCFQHALKIYTRQNFPQYWAMLQHNLGLAYYHRSQGERLVNLVRSIVCFNKAMQIYTQHDFPEQWKINRQDLKEAKKAWREAQKTWCHKPQWANNFYKKLYSPLLPSKRFKPGVGRILKRRSKSDCQN